MIKKIAALSIVSFALTVGLSACSASTVEPSPSAIVPVVQVDVGDVADSSKTVLKINSVQLLKSGDSDYVNVSVVDSKIVQFVEGYSNDEGKTFSPALIPVSAGETDVIFKDKSGKEKTVHYVVE